MTTINVTEQDILFGDRYFPTSCAVSLAIQRTLHTNDVCVSTKYVWVGEEDYDFPPDAVTFIEAFDMGLIVKPILFELPEGAEL